MSSIVGLNGRPLRADSPDWLAAAGQPQQRQASPTPATPENLQGIAAIHGALQLISGALGSLEYRLTQHLPDGGRQRVSSNDTSTALREWSVTCRESWIKDCLATGNGLLALRKNQRGGIEALERLEPNRVSLAVHNDGGISYEVMERKDIASPAESLPADDVCHLIYTVSRSHPMLGESPLASVAPSLALVLRVTETARTLYQNAAGVNIVLSHPKQLSPEAATRLKQSFENASTNANAYRALILQENTTVSQLTPSKALDMQLAELMPLTTRIVAQAFGLSAHLLGENESTSYSSAAESARSFARFCLKPWQTRINDALSRSLLTREQRAAGYAVSSDLESLTRGDGDELATVSSKLANAGLLSPNEIRDWYGQADVEGGDLLRAPTNTQPITDWSKPKTSKAMRVQNIRIKRAMSHAVSHNR